MPKQTLPKKQIAVVVNAEYGWEANFELFDCVNAAHKHIVALIEDEDTDKDDIMMFEVVGIPFEVQTVIKTGVAIK